MYKFPIDIEHVLFNQAKRLTVLKDLKVNNIYFFYFSEL